MANTIKIHVTGDQSEAFLERLMIVGAVKNEQGQVTLKVPTLTELTYVVEFVEDPRDAYGILIAYNGMSGHRVHDYPAEKAAELLRKCREVCPEAMILVVSLVPSYTYPDCCLEEVKKSTVAKYNARLERSSLRCSYACLSEFMRQHSANPYIVMQI
ncbi:MAG: hypothetical protein ACYCQJ_13655 [Nitrososphaerales archaeon]